MIKEPRLQWEEFKNDILLASDASEWIYRGHASEKWMLETTLYRFLNKQEKTILASDHYKLLLCILANDKIRMHPDFADLILPEKNPFIIGMLTGDEQHEKDFKRTFHLMIKLRQLGFPSPLLDWTRNPEVAAFFAFSNIETNECISILRAKPMPGFKPFGLRVEISDFYFSAEDLSGLRHTRQESIYSLAIQQEHADTLVSKDKRKGPILHLAGYEELSPDDIVIEKYVISDSKERRLEILEELYVKGFSFEAIYGDSHILENTLLKDLAIKEILLKIKANR